MSKSLSWLHLSDLHLRSGDQYDQSVMLSSLLMDIKSLVDHSSTPINLVYITGDIAFSGNPAEYSIATDFIKKLAAECSIPLERIYCVPGNHDVDRRTISPFLTQAGQALITRELVSDVIGTHQVALFNNRLKHYYEFVKALFPWAATFSEKRLSFTENIMINGISVSLIGLNSAWLSGSGEDHGRIIIGERQVREALTETKRPDLLIGLMHHPLSYLAEFDASDVQALLDNRCDFVLHGHIHDFGAVRLSSPDSEVFYFAAGATYQGRRQLLAYNIVQLDLDAGRAVVSLRRYSDRAGGFWAPDTQMYRSATQGVLTFTLPERLSHSAQPVELSNVSERMESFVPENQLEPIVIEPAPAVSKPPADLVKAIQNGQCLLFAGAGASIDAKLPTWQELLRDLVKRVSEAGTMMEIEEEEIARLFERRDLLILAAYCRDRLGAYDFAKYLKTQLTDSGRTSRTHRVLADIPFRAAVTTNFDTFIEHFHKRATVVLPDRMEKLGAPGVEELLNDRDVFPIVKIHGSVEDVDSIVLTQGDFRNTIFTKPKYREFLRRLFTDSTIFFYGYGFRDPNVDFALQESWRCMRVKQGHTMRCW